MTKYQEFYLSMIKENEKIFSEFKEIHDKYSSNHELWKKEFNEKGEIIIEIIRYWERKLCRQSERGQYGRYSSNLSEKFWSIIRKSYPLIDFIGIK